MKKSVVFLFITILIAMLSGCILSKSPNTSSVILTFGSQKTFSVEIFPSNAKYTWTLDGSPLPNSGKSYLYTALGGNHTLVVKAKHILGTDTQTWNIHDPITDLLNSMVSILGGTFIMGSTDNEYNWAQYTTPVHQVTLQGFEIGAYEVTQAQYEAIMGTNPSWIQGPGTENNPVERVNWFEAREFCTLLSAQTGRTFTLPSEAQWEYACRAGSTTLYNFGDDDGQLRNYAWYSVNSNYTTHPVGAKLPNNWGLYDMHGNVEEWCLDSWHDNYIGAPTDGSAWEPETGSLRIIRGGCWGVTVPWPCRSAYRISTIINTDFRGNDWGFRVVAVPASE